MSGVGRFSSGNATVPVDAPIQPPQAFVDMMITALAIHAPDGGMFVSGGTQDGVYTKRNVDNGKVHFSLLGHSATDADPASAIIWVTLASDYGPYPSAPAWIHGDGDGNVIYYSLSDVATPDLATNWKNASDDSPASITVTAIGASAP